MQAAIRRQENGLWGLSFDGGCGWMGGGRAAGQVASTSTSPGGGNFGACPAPLPETASFGRGTSTFILIFHYLSIIPKASP